MFVVSCALVALAPRGISRRSAIGAASVTSLIVASPSIAAVPSGEGTEREELTTVFVPTGSGGGTVGVARRRFTGAGDSRWKFPQRDISAQVYSDAWPDAFPFTAADFTRIDEAPDTDFYRPFLPKLVYHIDEAAVCALMRYYDSAIPDGSDILDICSSWVSHYPRSFMTASPGSAPQPGRMNSITGTGINTVELGCNDQLSSFKQADLNASPKLPFPDRSFDAITCVVSFDYLTRPLEVLREVARVLRPGGQLIISQSNRCFYTKAVGIWTQDMSDLAHLRVLGTYIHFASGAFSAPRAIDISPTGPGTNDPLFVITARRA